LQSKLLVVEQIYTVNVKDPRY